MPVAGLVPDDEELLISALKGELAVSNDQSRAGKAFSNIAARLDGVNVPIMDLEEKKSFWKRLFGKK